MILRILGADFSSANIGTLSTYVISKSIGAGISHNIPNFVDKNSSVNWVITLNEGYTFGTYSVTMGGEVIAPSVVDNVMTISIAEVTGNVRIVVATVNENGEEDEPTIPDEPVVPPVEPDEPETSTYYDITTQGTTKGFIKESQITYGSGGYLLTIVPLEKNVVSVEYQAFPTGAKFGSAFIDSLGNVIKMLDRTDVTAGERVTELVPEGATSFLHMWDNPNDSTVTDVEPFTYIRVYVDPTIVIEVPYIIELQDESNYNMLNTSNGDITQTQPTATGGHQCITICKIPSDATKVKYLTFKTGATYGSGFFDITNTFISGYAASTNEKYTLDIPYNAKYFYFMYPNAQMASDTSLLAFDCIEFIK